MPEKRPVCYCTGVQGSVGYSLYDARERRGGAGGMPVWRRTDAGACWGGRREAPTPDLLSSIRSRLQCRWGVRPRRAQIRSVRLRLLTEPQGADRHA
jgi:hypothetical protein